MLAAFVFALNGDISAENPTIKLYTGMNSKLGGYIELLIGLDENGKSFGYLTVGEKKDTIIDGSENNNTLSILLKSGNKLIIDGFRTDKLVVKNDESNTSFKLLKIKRESAINGFYSYKDDLIEVLFYVYQKRDKDYLSFSVKSTEFNYSYSGLNNSNTYGEYDIRCNDELIHLKAENEVFHTTINSTSINLKKH